MDTSDDLGADAALKEIGRMRQQIGRSAKWAGRMYLVWGVATVFYWSAMFFGPLTLRIVAMIAWVAMTALSLVYVYMQRVHGRGISRFQFLVALPWGAVMVGAAFFASLVPKSPSGWWLPAGIAVAVVAATPVLYAGWRLHTWERDR
ncbi:hypothetical protein OG589_26985 [Sphaerisporangium sp. NBC_01403]|uniref:hypothetical protein n=1 Tax=Sphaerisporangium sp. NBC_01403 TaxID=2903599 RepID=UPI0032451AAD